MVTVVGRRGAGLLALVLSATVLVAVTAPAEAAPVRTTYTQTTKTYVGDTSYVVGRGVPDTVTIPAGPGTAATFPTSRNAFHDAVIAGIAVEIGPITHDRPDDLELVLVGPGGQQVLLMNDAGGANALSDDTFTFTIGGAALPDSTAIQDGGTYAPADYGSLDMAGLLPSPSEATDLSVLLGTRSAGSWKLYVYDDEAALGGTLDWRIDLNVTTTPYPSQIVVADSGTVSDVNVTLSGIDTERLADLDVLLVGPQGQRVTLLSDAGFDNSVSGLELRFSDEAAGPVPELTALASGTFRATNYPGTSGGDDAYPGVGTITNGAALLSAFDGTQAQGVWSLYAVDATGEGLATIASWSLDIEWADTTAPAGAVSIQGGASLVGATSVTLSLAASDPGAGATGVHNMRFSNDGKSWSPYRPYAATTTWSLDDQDGTKTVFAQFRDVAGNESPVVRDTIVLDATGPAADSVKPKKNAIGVSRKAKVKVIATELLDPSTVSKQTVRLKRGTKKVRATVVLKVGRKIVLKPKKPLRKGTYTASVSTEVTDAVGNSFDAKPKRGLQALTWSFSV